MQTVTVSSVSTPSRWDGDVIPVKVIRWVLSFPNEDRIWLRYRLALCLGWLGYDEYLHLPVKEAMAIAKLVSIHYREWKKSNFVTQPVGLSEEEIELAKKGTEKLLEAIRNGWNYLPPPWWKFD